MNGTRIFTFAGCLGTAFISQVNEKPRDGPRFAEALASCFGLLTVMIQTLLNVELL